jgi:hypothetical protein
MNTIFQIPMECRESKPVEITSSMLLLANNVRMICEAGRRYLSASSHLFRGIAAVLRLGLCIQEAT